MKDYRCKFCHKLLFRVSSFGGDIRTEEGVYINENFQDLQLEIKCPKCKRINLLTFEDNASKMEDIKII